MKKSMSILLIVAMLMFCLPFSLIAQGATESNAQQIEYTGGWNPSNYDPADASTLYQGKVAVRKTVAPTELENYFDITLEVVAKPQEQDQSVGVVVVMDISNTMNSTHTDEAEGKSRLVEAKASINNFIDLYAESTQISTDREFALVTFNSHAALAIEPTVITQNNAETIKNQVNEIVAPYDSTLHFTNIEGGLQLAKNIMKLSDATYKYIVFVTDGFPTTYIQSGRDSTSEIVGYDTYMTGSYDASKLDSDGYFADSVTGTLCLYGTSYSDEAAIRAAAVAKSIKDDGLNIFTIGIDVGAQSVQAYVDQTAGRGFSVVDRRGEEYEIGNTTDSYKNWLSTTIAGGPLLDISQFEGHRYAAGNDQDALNTAFLNIMDDIQLAPLYSIREANTVDPMSEYVEFLNFYGYDGAVCDSIKNSNGEVVAIFDDETDTINWVLIGSEFEKDETNGIYIFKISYRIRLMNEKAGFVSSAAVKTNETTTFNFKTVDNDGNILYGDNKIEYLLPEVVGYLGTLEFAKCDTDSEVPLPDAEFKLCHNGDECSICNGDVNIADMDTKSDENGKVLFENIPSGHEYTLTETKAPDGYILEEKEYSVAVNYGITYIDGTELEQDKAVYNTKIAPVEIDFAVNKTLVDDFGDRILKDGEFSFELIGEGYEGFSVSETVTNDEDGQATFGTVVLDKAGEYTFVISEITGEDETIDYSEEVCTVTVTVTQNGNTYDFETFINGSSVGKCNSVVFEVENKVLEPEESEPEVSEPEESEPEESEPEESEPEVSEPVVPGDGSNMIICFILAITSICAAFYAYKRVRHTAEKLDY